MARVGGPPTLGWWYIVPILIRMADCDDVDPARALLLLLARTPGDEGLATKLADLADAHAFADMEASPEDIAVLWSLADGCVRCPAEAGQPPALRATWRIVLEGLSDTVERELPPAVGRSLDVPFYKALLARLVIACRETAVAQERASETFAGVTLSTVTPDTDQPRTGSLVTLRQERTAASPAVATASLIGTIHPQPSSHVRTSQKRRAAVAPWSEERSLRALLYWSVAAQPSARAAAEEAICEFLRGPVLDEGGSVASAAAARLVLQVVLALLRGRPVDADDGMPPPPPRGTPPPPPLLSVAQQPMSTSAWLEALLPLHGVSRLVSETTAVLALFHEPLVKCLFQLVRARTDCVATIVRFLASQWPDVERGNSPKGVLLMHELDQLLRSSGPVATLEDAAPPPVAAPSSPFASAVIVALPLLLSSLSSDNSRLAQQALGILHIDGVLDVLVAHGRAGSAGAASPVAAILGVLWRGGRPHWNATVNKQTRAVIERLLTLAPAPVEAAAARICTAVALDDLPLPPVRASVASSLLPQ